MEYNRLTAWIKQERIFNIVEENHHHFINIFMELLGVSNEKILMMGDLGEKDKRNSALMLGCYAMAAEKLGLDFKISLQEPKVVGNKADEMMVRDMLCMEEESIFVICLSEKFGTMREIGKSFRKFTKQHNHRFVSTSSLKSIPTSKFTYLIDAININYPKLQEKGRKIKKIFDNGNEVSIVTRKGTDLIFDIKGVNSISNDGNYTLPGTGGNIPAGEVYLPCKKNGVSGTLVIDGSIRTRETTLLVNRPVKLTIENGSVISVKGDKKAEMLEKTLLWGEEHSKYPETAKVIGELGIGINPNARIVGPTIINEKTLGTAHIAIGSNYWFGGEIRSIVHLDHVFKEPMIKVDGEAINGILMKI